MSDTRIDLLKAHVRDVPDFPKAGILFKDITPLLASRAAFGACLDLFQERYAPQALDAVVGIESRGFIFGAALASRLDVGFVPVRKPGKLPSARERHEYELEYGRDALEIHLDALAPGARALVIDDLLATGGTAAAATHLVEGRGATVVERAFVIELTFLGGRARLGSGAPVFSLVTY